MSVTASRSGLLAAGVLFALNAVAAETGTSLTVYSSAQPGGIPAEWYRPLPGIGTPMANQLPGFALVRLERELQIPRGRGTIQFADVAVRDLRAASGGGPRCPNCPCSTRGRPAG